MTRAVMRAQFDAALRAYEDAHGPLPGIVQDERRVVLVEQLVESTRRNEYLTALQVRPGGPAVTDPDADAFSPLRAAILHERTGNRDEAFWLIFLFVHFGRHRESGWRLIADVYGQLGGGARWSWDAVRSDAFAFRQWLDDHVEEIKDREPRRGFGNHRKYESLDPWSDNGTGAVVSSYVDWVGPADHDARIAQVVAGATTAAARFDALYASIRSVRRFGRTAAFDYWATLSRLGIMAIQPSSACLAGATGPLSGARLLICGPAQTVPPAALEVALAVLRNYIDVGFDVLEDALCNWQKSPDTFRPFRG